MHITTLEAIVRWMTVAGGIVVVAVAITQFSHLEPKLIVAFPVLMASGITLNYLRGPPVVLPGAVLYLTAYAYLLQVAWTLDRRKRRNHHRRKDDPPSP